ncbi:MAG TPA: hypothetical protein VFX16_16185 [Pseudonocardiaceae bacterium]|nr:hypothetical protein [Pseudonocardiaceae bacterium]
MRQPIEHPDGWRAATGLQPLGVAVVITALVSGLPATSAYAVDTAGVPHTGSIPTSGPSTTGGFGGGPGGVGSTSSALASTLTEALQASNTRWAAATIGSQTAASPALSSGASVMAIGGFTGSDDSPTLAQFQACVAAGEIHYFVAGGGQGGGPGGGVARPARSPVGWPATTRQRRSAGRPCTT